jgi:aldehyde reductase
MIPNIPLDENGLVKCIDVDYVDTWKAMEACVRQGLVRSIGVSNFNSEQLKRLLEHCTIKPVTNQVPIYKLTYLLCLTKRIT